MCWGSRWTRATCRRLSWFLWESALESTWTRSRSCSTNVWAAERWEAVAVAAKMIQVSMARARLLLLREWASWACRARRGCRVLAAADCTSQSPRWVPTWLCRSEIIILFERTSNTPFLLLFLIVFVGYSLALVNIVGQEEREHLFAQRAQVGELVVARLQSHVALATSARLDNRFEQVVLTRDSILHRRRRRIRRVVLRHRSAACKILDVIEEYRVELVGEQALHVDAPQSRDHVGQYVTEDALELQYEAVVRRYLADEMKIKHQQINTSVWQNQRENLTKKSSTRLPVPIEYEVLNNERQELFVFGCCWLLLLLLGVN